MQRRQIIAYSTLLKELDIVSVRALEDLIIDTIYAVSLVPNCLIIFVYDSISTTLISVAHSNILVAHILFPHLFLLRLFQSLVRFL